MSDEPTERDVEALAKVLQASSATQPKHTAPAEHDARTVLASNWYAERIAEARREIAAEASRVAQIEWENGNVTVGAFERLEAALRDTP